MALSNEEIFDKEITSGDDDELSDEFSVEEIVKERWNGEKQRHEYWIKWEGFSSDNNTWEPYENLYGCPEKWDIYKKKKSKKMRKIAAKNNDNFIVDKDDDQLKNNKRKAKRIIKHEKRYTSSKRAKIESESEDCEEGTSKKTEPARKKITQKRKSKSQQTKTEELKPIKENRSMENINSLPQKLQEVKSRENENNVDESPNLPVSNDEQQSQECKNDESKCDLPLRDFEENNSEKIQEISNKEGQISPLNLYNSVENHMDNETLEKDQCLPTEGAFALKQKDKDDQSQQDLKLDNKDEKRSATETHNFMGKWWKDIEKQLLPEEELLRIPLEKLDSMEYMPIKPIDLGRQNKGITVATSIDKTFGLDDAMIESVIAILDDSSIGVPSSSNMETVKQQRTNMALVKFIGCSTPRKVPLELVENEYVKYINYMTTKWNKDKRGDYWNGELKKPQNWMTTKSFKAFETWKLYKSGHCK